jgi:hypothetical protein
MLFKRMPDVAYNYSNSITDPQFFIVKNIWRRNEVLDKYLTSLTLFDTYVIQDGETPESVSFNYYGDVFFGWTIFFVNEKSNYHRDWPMDAGTLKEYVYNKYPNPDASSHYETTKVVDALDRTIIEAGKQVPSNFSITYFDGTASAGVTVNPVKTVSYYEKETRENDARREIKLIRPAHIRDFVDVYARTLRRAGAMEIALSEHDVKIE